MTKLTPNLNSFYTTNSYLKDNQLSLSYPSGYFYKLIELFGQEYTLVRSYIDPVFADEFSCDVINEVETFFTTHKNTSTLTFSNQSHCVYWSLLRGDWKNFINVIVNSNGLKRDFTLETTLRYSSVYRSKMIILPSVINNIVHWNFEIWPEIVNQLTNPEASLIVHSFLNEVFKMKLFTEEYFMQRCTLLIHDKVLLKAAKKLDFAQSSHVESWLNNNELQDGVVYNGESMFVQSNDNNHSLIDTITVFSELVDVVSSRFKQRIVGNTQEVRDDNYHFSLPDANEFNVDKNNKILV